MPAAGWDLESLRHATVRGEAPGAGALPPLELDGLSGLLDRSLTFLRQYVVLGEHEAVAVVLWMAHTHAIDAADVTPYLDIGSAEKRAGKSTLLEWLDAMVARSWRVAGPSEAVTFRKITADKPTILLDEVDTIFGRGANDHEGLRQLLNAGFKRGAKIPRCVGDGSKMQLQDFETFCAKALAGIGRLPDTVADRAIRVEMRRKRRTDEVGRWRLRVVPPAATPLREALAVRLESLHDDLAIATPNIPDELNDRAQDAWEPLLAIADMAGERWPESARRAARALSGSPDDEEVPAGNRLLASLRDIFDRRGVGRLPTDVVIDVLVSDPEDVWCEWRGGHPITAKQLANLLRPYGIRSAKWRDGGETHRGYQRRDFEDAWDRWLSATLAPASQDPPQAPHAPQTASLSGMDVADSARVADVADVADTGGGDEFDVEYWTRQADQLGLAGT